MESITGSMTSSKFIPDDVLIEILLQLPLISLYLFKTVSKHWLSLITSPSFTLRLRNQRLPKIDPVCGLFLQQSDSSAFAPLDDRITASPFGSIITHAGSHFSVSQSCNGLLLCKNIHTFRECLVYNPFTNIFKSIQLPLELHQYNYCKDDTKFKLAFDPTKSCHYKVICVILTGGDSCHIPTYSSKTGKWSITGIQFSAYIGITPFIGFGRMTGMSNLAIWCYVLKSAHG
ncbi:F-box protein [Tanacetum coccineum]